MLFSPPLILSDDVYMKYFYSIIFWPIIFLCQLIALALISWHLAAQIHFAYPVGYELLGLEQHIAEYAPLNRYKEDFELITKQEHWHLFGEICKSIQDHGKGLADIQYSLSDGSKTSLMHQNEIIHLQDVANLIDKFYLVGEFSLVIWIAGLLFFYFKRPKPPSMKKVIAVFLACIGFVTLVIVFIGSKNVFYWFHQQVFPNGHQWFFYYQDSLMTTLMKAPDIFAFIATLLLSLLTALWVVCSFLTNRVR